MTSDTTATPWTGYEPVAAWDEAVTVDGDVRDPYRKVYREIDRLSASELRSRAPTWPKA